MSELIINAVVPRVQYIANGAQSVFDYGFPIFAASDMTVYWDDALKTGGYSVTGAGVSGGGTVVFTTAPANGVRVTLLRAVPIARTSDFQTSGAFRAADINGELDRLTAIAQQLAEENTRTLRRSAADAVGDSLQLPASEPGRALVWGPDGTIQNADGAIEASASAVAAAASAAAAALDAASIAGDRAAVAADRAVVAVDADDAVSAAAAAAGYAANMSAALSDARRLIPTTSWATYYAAAGGAPGSKILDLGGLPGAVPFGDEGLAAVRISLAAGTSTTDLGGL